MIFSFCLFNHSEVGRQSLVDLMAIVQAQLRDLGHEVLGLTDFPAEPPIVNLLFERFGDKQLDMLRKFRANHPRLILLGTERPEKHGFNGSSGESEMAIRMKGFAEACKYVDGVWYLAEEWEWYRRQHEHVSLIEFGYSPSLVQKNEIEPQFDFCIFGSLTRHRAEMANQLGKYAMVASPNVYPGMPFLPQAERNALVRSSKVVLHIKQDANWKVISASRCATSLYLGRPVISDPHDCGGPWKKIIKFVPEESFVMDALDMAKNWREEHGRQMAVFSETLSAEACLGDAVDKLKARFGDQAT